MRNKLVLSILTIAAVIFFFSQFLSQVSLKMGDDSSGSKQAFFYRIGKLLSPLDHQPVFQLALHNLKKGVEIKDNPLIWKSIDQLQDTVALNPLFYQAYYYLGKAYVFYRYPENEYFSEAIQCFKKAAFLRGGNKSIALDNIKILLSLWPLLTNDDRQFCKDLLYRNAKSFNWEEFQVFVELWALYIKDVEFLEGVLQERPEFFYQTSVKLVDFHIPLKIRWAFLCSYETYLLKDLQDRFKVVHTKGKIQLNDLRIILTEFSAFRGYYLLAEKKVFPELEFFTLYSKIIQEYAGFLLDNKKISFPDEQKKELEKHILEFIRICTAPDLLTDLRTLLDKKNFFTGGDLKRLYIKFQLDLKLSNFNELTTEIENLKSTISYLNTEQIDDYIKILLTLADANIANSLLSAADKILREIVDLRPGNADAFWRLLAIRAVLGSDDEFEKQYQQELEKIRNSCQITLSGERMRSTAYLISRDSIELIIPPDMKNRLQGKKILMVFADEKIKFESYISDLQETNKINLYSGADNSMSHLNFVVY